MTTAHIKTTQVAGPADCQHWLPANGRYLELPSGRQLCPLCGAPWCITVAERRALLSVRAPSGVR